MDDGRRDPRYDVRDAHVGAAHDVIEVRKSAPALGRLVDQVSDVRRCAQRLVARGRLAGRLVRHACGSGADRGGRNNHERAREMPAPRRTRGVRFEHANLFVEPADAGLRTSHCDLLEGHSMTRSYDHDLSETFATERR
jgi:hypothetical protein